MGNNLGLGLRIYKVIVLGLIRLVLWLWLVPKKGGIVIAKSIFSQEYEIHLDILQQYRNIIGKQKITQSRTDLQIFRRGVDGLYRGMEAHSAEYDSGNF